MAQPPLIDTDDPAELLGLSAGASLRDLKQAYARLIKQYRPEQAPAEFQRIHSAFEELRRRFAGGYGHLPQREFREPDHATTEVESKAETEPATPVVQVGTPDPAEFVAEAFMAQLHGGASSEELGRIWLDGLAQDLDLVSAIFELSPPAVLEHLCSAGYFSWPRLAPRRFPFRGALWSLHAQRALAQDRCDELLEEAQSDGFRDATEHDEHLREALWLPLTVAAWDRPSSAFESFAWAVERSELSEGAKTFMQACQLRESLKELESLRWVPPEFLVLMRLGRVSPQLRHELLLSIDASRDSHAEVWWLLCEKLTAHGKLLGFYLLGTLAMLDLTYEAPLGALPRQQREILEQAIEDARVPPTSLTYSVLSWGLMLCLLVSVVLVGVLLYRGYQALFGDGTGGALLPPLEALLLVLVALIATGIATSVMEDDRGCRILRKDLARSGIGYQQLVDWIRSDNINKPAGIVNNTALRVYLTLNLAVQRSLWTQPRHSMPLTQP